MARSMVDGATSSLTLAIGPAPRTGVLTASRYNLFNGAGMMTSRLIKNTMSSCFFV